MLDARLVEAAAAELVDATHILVLSGAGMSAESGIPTFREAQTGLWERYSPQDLATPEAFAAEPPTVWAWYRWRRTLIARGGVNPGHRAIAALGERRHVGIATQNVDGLHAAAGSTRIAELHGNVWRERCTACDTQYLRPVEAQDDNAEPPTCTACGALTRPDVVWFGEALPADAIEWTRRELHDAQCVLVVGTSNQVYPAAALVEQAIASAATVIEVNPRATSVSSAADIHLAASAGQALGALIDAFDAREPHNHAHKNTDRRRSPT